MVTPHMKKTHSLIMRSSPLLCRERYVQVTHGEQRDFYHQPAHIQNNEPFFHRGGSSLGGSGIADPNVLPCLCNDEHPKDLHRHHDEGTYSVRPERSGAKSKAAPQPILRLRR